MFFFLSWTESLLFYCHNSVVGLSIFLQFTASLQCDATWNLLLICHTLHIDLNQVLMSQGLKQDGQGNYLFSSYHSPAGVLCGSSIGEAITCGILHLKCSVKRAVLTSFKLKILRICMISQQHSLHLTISIFGCF